MVSMSSHEESDLPTRKQLPILVLQYLSAPFCATAQNDLIAAILERDNFLKI